MKYLGLSALLVAALSQVRTPLVGCVGGGCLCVYVGVQLSLAWRRPPREGFECSEVHWST